MLHLNLTRRALAALAALLLAGAPLASQAQSNAFVPYDGKVGYQSLAISANTFYLAFHGNRDTSGPWVDAAWRARAAQLCAATGAEAFVALRYIDEPVLVGDADLAALGTQQAWSVLVAGTPIYIPMFIPSGPRLASIDAAGKSGAVRCLASDAKLRDATRAMRNADALDAARQAGVAVR